MEAGRKVEKGGEYCCLYHLKRKTRLRIGDTLPRCDFTGLRCEGNWHLLKEIKEKTHEEKMAANDRRREAANRSKDRDKDYHRELKKPKYNKWDFEK